jgi:hypothetical protein
MIAPGVGTGILQFGTSTGQQEEVQRSFVTWQLSASTSGESNVLGSARNAELVWLLGGTGTPVPAVTLFTSEGMLLKSGFAAYGGEGWAPTSSGTQTTLFIPNSKFNFGLTMAEGEAGALNSIALPVGDTGLKSSSKDSLDNYDSNSILYLKENGKDYVYLTGINNGFVKIALSTAFAENQISGQVSPYPYYGIWANESNGRNSVYAIGYQSSAYAYEPIDICHAKLYEVRLFDAAAAANLAATSLLQNESIRTGVLAGNMSIWNGMLSAFNITGADLSKANQYRAFLIDGKVQKANAITEFYDLAGMEARKRTDEVKAQIELCLYPVDLEQLMAVLRWDLIGTQISPPDIRYETGRIDYEHETIGDYEQYIDDRISESADGNQEAILTYTEEVRAVVRQLKQQAGLTDEAWDERMNAIVTNLHLPDTWEEYAGLAD